VVASILAIVAFGWFDVRQRARTDRGPKFHRTDLTVYLAAAEALASGGDPYDAASPRGWRYVYPPLLAIVARPLSRLPPPDAALVVYVVSVAALGFAARALARGMGTRGPVAVGLGVLACAPFVVQSLQRGQVTVVLLAVQVAGWAALARGRGVRAGLWLAAGVGLRLTPLLPAAMVGLACLVRIARGDRSAWRFPAGLAAGLACAFVVVPLLALGPARAREVTERWLEVGREVYAAGPGQLADLRRDYAINEWSFKNQGVRRVAGTTLARLEGLPVADDGRPALGAREAVADRVAWAVAALAGLAAIGVALRRMGDPKSAAFRAAFAVGVALPAFGTRYCYPVHLVVLVPLLAEVARALPHVRARAAAVLWAAGLAAFYAGHVVVAWRPAAEHGVLLAALLAVLWVAPRPAGSTTAGGAP
jgi:hypothetical protein